MDVLIPVATFLVALFGAVAIAAGHESRDGFATHESQPGGLR
jgi:hypothetical protein